jgi:hypothetical protein
MKRLSGAVAMPRGHVKWVMLRIAATDFAET